jgi:hypothetical protein
MAFFEKINHENAALAVSSIIAYFWLQSRAENTGLSVHANPIQAEACMALLF